MASVESLYYAIPQGARKRDYPAPSKQTDEKMATFDPTDKKYQKLSECPPDKEVLRKFPPEREGWVVAHNSIRGEIKDLKECLEIQKNRGPLKEWEAVAFRKVFAAHVETVLAHHHNEDEIFVPEVSKRFHYPEKLSSDHKGLIELLTTMEKEAKDVKEGKTVDGLLKSFLEYEKYMLPHLKEEEDIGLPLYRAYFTPKESADIEQKILAQAPIYELGSFIFYHTAERFRNEFMPENGIPFFVWYLAFNGHYKKFVGDIVVNFEALKSGEPPQPKKDKWFDSCDIL